MHTPSSRRTLVSYLTLHPSVIVVNRGTPIRLDVPKVERRRFIERHQEDLFFHDATSILRHVRAGGPLWGIEFRSDGFDIHGNGNQSNPEISYYYRPDHEAVDSPIPYIFLLALQGRSIPSVYIEAVGFNGMQSVLRTMIIAGTLPPETPTAPSDVPDVTETSDTETPIVAEA